MLTLGDHHETGGSDVEALHNALTLRRPTRGDRESSGRQMLDDAGTVPAQRRVSGHTSRLVDDDDVRVIVNDSHPLDDLRGDRRGGDGIGQIDVEHLPHGDANRRPGHLLPVQEDQPFLDEIGNPGSRHPAHPSSSDINPLSVKTIRYQQDAHISSFSSRSPRTLSSVA